VAPRQPGAGGATTGKSAAGPLSGHRILVLGGPHEQAAATRTRITELGGAAAVNLSAGVTDVIILAGGETDRRMPRITLLGLPVHDRAWLDAPAPVTASEEPAAPTGAARQDTPPVLVLPRGGVIDLPVTGNAPCWSVAASWAHQTSCEIDVVAFTVDEDEQVSCDEDFVFYGAPESPGGTVRLATDGPTEQTVTVDLAALPTAARKVVIAAAIDGPTTFAAVGAIEITIAPGTSDRPLAQATLDAATTERTLLLAELYRRGPLWRVRAVGQGYDYGLATLARGFGVDVVG
jgi:DNA polymerase-3 subunit epsilon